MPHSHSPLFPYMPSRAPELDLHNSARLENLIRDGKLYISLQDAIALALENNLDIAYARYYVPSPRPISCAPSRVVPPRA